MARRNSHRRNWRHEIENLTLTDGILGRRVLGFSPTACSILHSPQRPARLRMFGFSPTACLILDLAICLPKLRPDGPDGSDRHFWSSWPWPPGPGPLAGSLALALAPWPSCPGLLALAPWPWSPGPGPSGARARRPGPGSQGQEAKARGQRGARRPGPGSQG